MKSSLMRVLLVASALVVGHSMAFADSGPVAYAGSSHDDYFKVMTALCPTCSKVLTAVGADYKKKCGFEPTVAQYQDIAHDTPAYTFRMAIATIKNGDVDGWTPKEHAQYDDFIKNVDCAKI